MTEAVFTYGTLMVPSVMHAVTGEHLESEPAFVRGFERFCVVDAVYPGLLATGRGATRGVLYRGLDAQTLAILDRFEGDLYERRPLEVERDGEPTELAQCWVVPDSCASYLDGTSWSLDDFQRRHLAAYLQVCREFRREDVARFGATR